MSSEISFRKLFAENIKNQAWLIVFFSIVGFITFPVISHFLLQNTADYIITDSSSGMTHSAYPLMHMSQLILGTSNVWSYVFCILGAVISSVTAFNHIYTREKTDFFHSVGIKRHKLFLSRFICGLFVFIVPYIANVIITVFAVLPLNSALYTDTLRIAFGAMGTFILGYCAIFASCVLACVLTGRVIISLILMLMIFIYVPVCRFTLFNMIGTAYPKLWLHGFKSYGEYFTPVGALIRAGFFGMPAGLAALFIWLIACITLGLIVYNFRPSEAAGRAMSFEIMKPIVKIAMGIIAGLLTGVVFSNVLYYQTGERFSSGWFWFGAIISIVVVQIALEAIYNKDIKSIVTRWKSFLIMLGGIILTAGLILSDPLKANVWFPERDELAEMSCANIIFNPYARFTFTDTVVGSVDREFGSFYLTKNKGELFVTDFEPLYELVSKNKNGNADNTFTDKDDFIDEYVIGYKLKNGAVKYRKYDLKYNAVYEALKELSASEEFKTKYYPAFNYDFSNTEEVRILDYDDRGNYGYEKSVKLSKEQLTKLVESYKADCLNLNIGEADFTGGATMILYGKNNSDPELVFHDEPSGYRYAEIYLSDRMTQTCRYLSELTGDDISALCR